jgi:hypothetical protein
VSEAPPIGKEQQMTGQKSFKRRIHMRMEKTGERSGASTWARCES